MSSPIPPIPTKEEFAGKIALITGGTNGLGRHLCQTLIEHGAEVFFCGRKGELGQQLARQWGPHAHFTQCELSDAQQTIAFVEECGQFRGKIDYLVNNAAIDPVYNFADAKLEDFDRVVAINLRSYFVVSQTALRFLKAGDGKAIVNICTTNFMMGCDNATVYNAAKSGIIGFSRSLARSLGPMGIRVNVVSPGWIMTERQLREKVREKDKADLIREQCVKELLTEQHVTPATLFLLSKAAGGISGQNLVVDGGKVMQ